MVKNVKLIKPGETYLGAQGVIYSAGVLEIHQVLKRYV